jgi:hypothetical protein
MKITKNAVTLHLSYVDGTWLYLGDFEGWSNPTLAFFEQRGWAEVLPEAAVPASIEDIRAETRVSMRQLRIVLARAGMLDSVQAAVTASGVEAQIEWEHASYIDRMHPLVVGIGQLETLTDLQVDDMFAYAATI